MHIPDGPLSGSTEGLIVLGVGWLGTAGALAWSLRRLDCEQVPRVALLTAAFFVATLVRVPLGLTSAHLVLNGLLGLVLGWAAVPAIFLGLLLQAVYLQFGGITTLGVNTLVMAMPAVACHYLLGAGVRQTRPGRLFAAGMAAGALAVMLSASLEAGAWFAAGKEFRNVGLLTLASHVGVALTDGAVAGSVVVFLHKVRPELIQSPQLVPLSS